MSRYRRLVAVVACASAVGAMAASPQSSASVRHIRPSRTTVLYTASDTSWFRDPLTRAQRRARIDIPAHPQRLNDTPRQRTVATLRTGSGSLAVPASMAYGHPLVRGQALTFDAGALFRVGSADLTAHARHMITRLTYSMARVSAVTCQGFSDYGSAGLHTNVRISARRARSVCRALRGQTGGLTTHSVGYGASRPAVVGMRTPQRAANRRVVLVVRANVPEPADAAGPPTVTAGSYSYDGGTGDYDFDMTWTTPVSDGGSAITGYEWSIDGGATWTAFDTYATSGTDNTGSFDTGINACDQFGTTKTVFIRAVNGAGEGDPSNGFDILLDYSC